MLSLKNCKEKTKKPNINKEEISPPKIKMKKYNFCFFYTFWKSKLKKWNKRRIQSFVLYNLKFEIKILKNKAYNLINFTKLTNWLDPLPHSFFNPLSIMTSKIEIIQNEQKRNCKFDNWNQLRKWSETSRNCFLCWN